MLEDAVAFAQVYGFHLAVSAEMAWGHFSYIVSGRALMLFLGRGRQKSQQWLWRKRGQWLVGGLGPVG